MRAPPNDPRSPGGRAPHVESWFLRFVDPRSPRALWLKLTTLEGRAGGLPDVAEAWAAYFDHDRTLAVKQSSPRGEASLGPPPAPLRAAGATLRLDERGGLAEGSLQGPRGALRWSLRLRRLEGPLGAPLRLFPSDRLVDARFPRNQLLTPLPALVADGTLQLDGVEHTLDGWIGSQGHNWGPAHAERYAWGQVVFVDASGAPFALAEGASGNVRVGPATTPLLSLLVVRVGEREHRFDRIADLWNQSATLSFPRWSLSMRGPAGRAHLSMEALPSRVVGLGYENPDGSLARCLNSKLARVSLRLEPVDGEPLHLTSAHGGALEFLVRGPEPRVELQA